MKQENLDRVWGRTDAMAAARRFADELEPGARLRARLAARLRRLRWRVSSAVPAVGKRGVDIAGAVAGMVALSPVLVLTALAIKLEDRGPVFFRQTRVGLRGRTFGMWKFRSMVVDAEALQAKLDAANESGAGVLFKMRRDPRITRVGQVIRKLSIDELPQLLNVLNGSMSVVGPRPALPREVAAYTQDERVRLDVKPGITCIWQISGRSDIDFKGQVQLDVAYIREQSVGKDLKIIARTVPVVVTGKGAY